MTAIAENGTRHDTAADQILGLSRQVPRGNVDLVPDQVMYGLELVASCVRTRNFSGALAELARLEAWRPSVGDMSGALPILGQARKIVENLDA